MLKEKFLESGVYSWKFSLQIDYLFFYKPTENSENTSNSGYTSFNREKYISLATKVNTYYKILKSTTA